MKEMTSRERVWAALNHQEPDRVPLDIGGGYSTTIVIEGYEKLKDYLGITTPTRVMDRVYRLAYLDQQVLTKLGSDCYPLGTGKAPQQTDPDTLTDIFGIVYHKVHNPYGYYYEFASHPLSGATIADLDRFPWPDANNPSFTGGLADEAQELFENTDYAIMADAGLKNFFELAYPLRGLQNFLIDLATNPQFVITLMERIYEINVTATRNFLEKAGRYIHIFRLADDLATQRSLLMSPATYRAFIKPYQKKFIEFIKEYTEAKIFFHSCGRLNDLLEDLIEIGVDIVNPVQVSAMGDTAQLKQRYGDRLVFWGGIDTQYILPHGTVEEVEQEVHKRIWDLAPGGGYVAASVHNIQPDVQPENILAMARAVQKYGKYPLN